MTDDLITPNKITQAQKIKAEKLAKEALHALGEEDLLYSHYGGVFARPEAYRRLADFFARYVEEGADDD